jgi:hypothetical protein
MQVLAGEFRRKSLLISLDDQLPKPVMLSPMLTVCRNCTGIC